MKSRVYNYLTHPYYLKTIEWGRLLTITGSAQVLVQVIGLISGILIIRLLSTQEYAFYTLANTMLGAMTILADGGISAGVMAEGGKVWQDKDNLGVVLVTGLSLRKKFGIISLFIASPFLLYLLLHHGAGWIMSVIILLSLIPAFFASISDNLLEIAPKLKQDIKPLQKNQVEANTGRLVLIGISLLIFPWAFVALIGGGLPRVWANIRLFKISAKYANFIQKSDPGIRKKVLAFVKRILPGAIYYCVSGQITIWLISIFGVTKSIAQLGALGRIAMLLAIFNGLFNTLLLPRFARLSLDKKKILSFYKRAQLMLFFTIILMITGAYIFSDSLLWILGPKYYGLQKELLLSIIGSSLALVSGSTFSLCTVRGWIINPIILISISITSIICAAITIDISSLQGVLKFNIFIAAVQLIIHEIYAALKIHKLSLSM